MNQRERLHADPSTAEIQVYHELQRQGIAEYERDWVLMFIINEVFPIRKEQVTKEMVQKYRFTLPDFCSTNKQKPVYLDGWQVHKKPNRSRKDSVINQTLSELGWSPLRIAYNGCKLPLYKLKMVVNEMKEFLEK